MLQKIIYNFDIALEALRQNTLRSFLTSLGIIFGVASVIAMLAIGRGAQEEVLQKMKLLGTNNVIIEPVIQQQEGDVSNNQGSSNKTDRWSPGLSLQDVKSIRNNIPRVEAATPEIVFETPFIRQGHMRTAKLVGVNHEYFRINGFSFQKGKPFSTLEEKKSKAVCIIGSEIQARFFAGEDPMGKKIKAGDIWLTVVGVLKKRDISTENIKNLGIRNYNMDVYTPASTVLLRYKNRALVTGQDIQAASASKSTANENNGSTETKSSNNNNQVDKVVVRVTDNKYSAPIADVMSRMLKRRHNGIVDTKVIVPERLLKQQRQTQHIFNIVLACIASISLIVGGIGIMNIMLASVVDRYREIGVRRAVGALKQDIQLQFLTEALVISISGGVLGIVLGIALSYIIQLTAGIFTIVTLTSILISFGVATLVGVVFGYIPARRAARQDPVNALRHE